MSEVIVTTAEQLNELVSAAVKQAVGEALRERQLPIIMTPERAAEELDVSVSTMYRAMKIHGFPITRDFGHTKIVSDDLLQWIKSRGNYDLIYKFGS